MKEVQMKIHFLGKKIGVPNASDLSVEDITLRENNLMNWQRSIGRPLNQIDLTEDDNGYPEGKQQLRIHLIRERDPRVIREAKRRYKQKNEELSCQACGFNFVKVYGEIGEDYIEGHHINPVSDQETESITRIEDIALLCSNCHKMIHRRRPWLCLDELKKLIVKS